VSNYRDFFGNGNRVFEKNWKKGRSETLKSEYLITNKEVKKEKEKKQGMLRCGICVFVGPDPAN